MESKLVIPRDQALKLLQRLAPLADRMTQWERDFCYDMLHVVDLGGNLSNRQYAKLKSFETRYFGS